MSKLKILTNGKNPRAKRSAAQLALPEQEGAAALRFAQGCLDSSE